MVEEEMSVEEALELIHKARKVLIKKVPALIRERETLLAKKEKLHKAVEDDEAYEKAVKSIDERVGVIDTLLEMAEVPQIKRVLEVPEEVEEAPRKLPTDLRHDLEYLRMLLEAALEIHGWGLPDRATYGLDVIGYFSYLTLDVLADEELALRIQRVQPVFGKLYSWLDSVKLEMPQGDPKRDDVLQWRGFLFALTTLLEDRIDMLETWTWKTPRQRFMESWFKTTKRLGL